MTMVVLQVTVHAASLLLGAYGYVDCTTGHIWLGSTSMLTSAILVLAFYLCAGRSRLLA